MKSNILLVVTTYNQSEYTKLCFDSLKKLDDNFDVLVIDDYSSDNTVELCKEYGYEIITKDKPEGLTDSWNKGYQRFTESGHYDYLIIANNDILIPDGALSELVATYEKWPTFTLLTPLSTENGVGHCKSQSINNFYEVNGCEEPENYQLVQDVIINTKKELESKNNLYMLDPLRMKMFSGFFFMMSRYVANYEYSENILFNPEYKITKNEDEFNWSKLIPNNDFPAVCKTSFVFHYKGVTAKGDLRDNKKWESIRNTDETN
jgi:glycosyltransferase involved in cell wall biosynthesis